MPLTHNDFCQLQPDGTIDCGDCVNWYGHWLYLERPPTRKFTSIFEIQPGAYVRHPDIVMTNYGFGAYYKSPYDGCITRDQLTGILAALIATENTKAVRRLIKHHKHTGMLFSYSRVKRGEDIRDGVRRFPDITGPEIWQMEMRGSEKHSYTFLLLCDLWLCACAFYDSLSKSDDNISFLMQAIVAMEHKPTVLKHILCRLMNLVQIKEKLESYWGTWRDKPFMVNLYMQKLISLGVV